MDGLRYHLLPFLEETGVSGIVENAEFCPKSFLIFRFAELLTEVIQCDKVCRTTGASITRDQVTRSSFMHYLVQLFHFFKANLVQRRALLCLLEQIIVNFSVSDHQVNLLVSNALVDQVSTVKMIYDQFD
jgi:hypothetical protein